MRYITFALAKGRLAKKTMNLLEQMGIFCEEMKDEKTRKLIFVNEELKLKFFLAKASDVPTYVEYGAADIGVVGKDTILEEGRKLYEVLDLGFGKCRMCVCGPKEARELLNHKQLIRVGSKYPSIAKDYFYHKKHQTVEPDDENAHLAKSELLVKKGDYQAACRTAEDLLERHPDSEAANFEAAKTFFALKQYDKALTLFGKVVRMNPSNASARKAERRSVEKLRRSENNELRLALTLLDNKMYAD